MLKRILSSLIGLPLVITALVFVNTYIFDAIIAVIALISIHEYYNAFDKDGRLKSLRWIGYASCLLIAFIHVIPSQYLPQAVLYAIPTIILLLFVQVIATEMKYNIKDISIILFGLAYIVLFSSFLAILRGKENGRILIWFVFVVAWGTDVFAYFIGRKFGKHKFTKISPNKSIEGCIAGIFGAVICTLIYALICNNAFNTNFNYIVLITSTIALSLIGQIGDLAASSIKRYTDIKDFGNLIPGHGGILDRFDSVIFIAPFAFFLLMLI